MANQFFLLVMGILVSLTSMAQPNRKYGILGQQAPVWEIDEWIDLYGNKTDPLEIDQFENKVIYLLAFQSWCPDATVGDFPL